RLLHRLRRRIAVVEGDQIDLAPVDAAALVDHPEIADLALAERAESGHRATIGHGLADPDFGGRDAAHFGGAEAERPRRQHSEPDRGNSCDNPHLTPPRLFLLEPLVESRSFLTKHATPDPWRPSIIAARGAACLPAISRSRRTCSHCRAKPDAGQSSRR